METMTPTDRTRVVRHAERAVYDREQIRAILDEGYICHIGFAVDGQPFVIPTAYGRAGDRVYVHGSAASRMVRSLAEGIDVCLTVTLVDGLVLARSAFRHSINYRSVVILGKARLVTDAREKIDALRCITDHVMPRRWEEVRPPNQTEMVSTSVLALETAEASAKVRTGPPKDVEDDFPMPVWAGVIPLETRMGEPVTDEHVPAGVTAVSKERFARFLL